MPGTYKIGAWYHSGNFRDQRFDVSGRSLALPASAGIGRPHWNNYAGYVVADQMLWRPGGGDQGVRAFARVSAGPGDRNLVDVAAIGGLSAEGLIPGRPDDVVGIGVAYTRISHTAQALGRDLVTVTGSGQPFRNNETVLEATYLLPVAPWWTLQGDIQYVVNPGAGIPGPLDNFSRTPLKNATVLGLRTTIVF